MIERNIAHKIPKFHDPVSVFDGDLHVNITQRMIARKPYAATML
jgi:hypothetical protein